MAGIHQLGGLRRWHVVIPNAAVLTLHSVPLANVAYPVNTGNYLVVVDGISVQGNVAAGAYTGNAASAVIQLTYGNSSGPVAANSQNIGAVLAANNSFISYGLAQGFTANAGLIAGQSLTLALTNGGSDLGGGNANNSVVVEFQTVELDASGSAF